MNLKHKVFSFAAASIFALSLGSAAMAQEAPSPKSTTGVVTQEITAGNLSYWISGGAMDDLTYAESPQTSYGKLTVSANGNGNLEGWTLQVQATDDFTYSGSSHNGVAIPAGNLSLTGVVQPYKTAGQEVTRQAGAGPMEIDTGVNRSLGTPLEVITAGPGYGSGAYSQVLDVSLNVPAYSQTGTYTGEVTVSTVAAPQ